MDRITPRAAAPASSRCAAVIVDNVVEFCVSITVHPVDQIMPVIPAPTSMEPVHLSDTVADCLN